MKKSLEDSRTMFYTVRDFISNAPAETLDLMPFFSDVSSAFDANVLKIPNQSETQSTNRVGNRLIKDTMKKEMVVEAINVSARVRAFAVNTDNVYLFNEMGKSYSTILYAADTFSADLCSFIKTKAESLLVDLAPYGVTAALLTALEKRINNFIGQIPKPRIGIMERKEATKQLNLLFAACRQDLKVMDKLVAMLRFQDPVFYDNYFSARKIIRTGKRTLAIKGVVVDVNGNPLEKVDVTLKNTSFTRKTSENGVFEIKNLEGGIYQLVFARPGYVETTVETAVTSTLTTDISVTMVSKDIASA
jgi:hypothetical protein